METFALYGLGSCINNYQRILVTARGVAMQFHMASMTKNWKTTTQVVKLSAHLLSMLYCCAFISRMHTADSDACEGRLVCYRFKIVIMRCTTNAVTHRGNMHTRRHRHWHAGMHNTVCVDQLTCIRDQEEASCAVSSSKCSRK